MSPLRLLASVLLILASQAAISVASDATGTPEPSKIRSFTGGWGKGTGHASSQLGNSRLYDLPSDAFKKTAELDAPVRVEILEVGRIVEGLEGIKDRIIDVKITNPNPYPIFFQGRQYRDNSTIKPGWRTLRDGVWVDAAWDWCRRSTRDWDLEPNGSMKLMIYLHPQFKEQQIVGRFYRTDQPSVQSDCLLYEKQ